MRVRLALIPLVAAAALLGGCATTGTTTPGATTAPAGNGVAALSADEIGAKAKAALAAAKSFHIKGAAEEDGNKISLDLTFAGKDWAGNVSASGLSFDIIVLSDTIYIKAPDDFWATLLPPGQESAIAALKGKWIKTSSTTPGISSLADSFKLDDLTPSGTLTKGTTSTVNGTPAIGIVDKDGSTMYVATEGDPVPLQIVDKDGSKLDFSQYNSAPAIAAPAATDVFDLSTLMGG